MRAARAHLGAVLLGTNRGAHPSTGYAHGRPAWGARGVVGLRLPVNVKVVVACSQRAHHCQIGRSGQHGHLQLV
jgi:hypothetical protein